MKCKLNLNYEKILYFLGGVFFVFLLVGLLFLLFPTWFPCIVVTIEKLKIILPIFTTLSVGFIIKDSLTNNNDIANKIFKHTFLDDFVILDAIDKLGLNDVNRDKIINEYLKISEQYLQKEHKSWQYFIVKHNRELFLEIQHGETTPKTAYHKFLLSLCEAYSSMNEKDEFTDEDKKQFIESITDILNFKK